MWEYVGICGDVGIVTSIFMAQQQILHIYCCVMNIQVDDSHIPTYSHI